MKQIIEKINKSWHSNPPCDQQIMLSVGSCFHYPMIIRNLCYGVMVEKVILVVNIYHYGRLKI